MCVIVILLHFYTSFSTTGGGVQISVWISIEMVTGITMRITVGVAIDLSIRIAIRVSHEMLSVMAVERRSHIANLLGNYPRVKKIRARGNSLGRKTLHKSAAIGMEGRLIGSTRTNTNRPASGGERHATITSSRRTGVVHFTHRVPDRLGGTTGGRSGRRA